MRKEFNSALSRYTEQLKHHEQSVQYNNRILTIAVEQATKNEEVAGYNESQTLAKLAKQIQTIHDALFKNCDPPQNADAVKDELSQVESSIEALKKQLNDFELANKQKSALIRDLEDQKHTLDRSLLEATAVSGDKKGLYDSSQQIAGLNSQIMQLKQEIDVVSKSVRSVSDQLEKALYDKKTLGDALEDAKERESRIQKQLDEQVKLSSLQNSDADEATKFLQQQKEEAQAKVHELEDEIGRLNNNLQVLQSEKEELNETNESQSKMVQELRDQISTINSASGDTQTQLETLTNENNKLKEQITNLETQNKKLEDQCENDMKKLMEMDEEAERKADDFSHLQQKYDSQLREHERLNELISQLETEKEAAVTSASSAAASTGPLQQENEDLKTEISTLQAEKSQLSNEKEELEQLLQQARQEASEAISRSTLLSQQLEDLKSDQSEQPPPSSNPVAPISSQSEEDPVAIDDAETGANSDNNDTTAVTGVSLENIEEDTKEQQQQPEMPPREAIMTPEAVTPKEDDFSMLKYLQTSRSQDRGVFSMDNDQFDSNEIRKSLLKAVKGKNKQQILEIAKALNGLDAEQRVEVINGWQDALSLPDSELLKRMIISTVRNDVNVINNGMKNSKYELLAEVICTKTNDELRELCKEYELVNGAKLSKVIANNFSIDTNLRAILIKLVTFSRVEDDPRLLDNDALKLESIARDAALIRDMMTKDQAGDVCNIVAVSSWPRIFKLCELVSRDLGQPYETIDGFVGRVLGEKNGATIAVKILLQMAYSRADYYNKLLFESMAGAGTRVDDLYRILISRAEIDIRAAIIAFNNDNENNNGKTTNEWFAGENQVGKDLPLIALLSGSDILFTKNTLPFYERVVNDGSKGYDILIPEWQQNIDNKTMKLKFRIKNEIDDDKDVGQILAQIPNGVSKCTKDQKSELKKLFAAMLPIRTYEQRERLMAVYEREYLSKEFNEGNIPRRTSRFAKSPTNNTNDSNNKSLLSQHIEGLLNDTTGRQLLVGLCMSNISYVSMTLCDALSNKDFEWFHIILSIIPRDQFNGIIYEFTKYSKKQISFADLVNNNCSATHGAMIMDILRCERKSSLEEIDYQQIVDDVKLLRYILLNKEMNDICKESGSELEKLRGKMMQSQLEVNVCVKYSIDKPKKDGKLDKQIVGYLLTQRSYKHIRIVNDVFNQLSLTFTLYDSISRVLGKSQATSLMQIILNVSIDKNDFIAKQLPNLLKKNSLSQLGFLFIYRSEIDFDLIRSTFEYKNYGEGVCLKGWVHKNLQANHNSLTTVLKSICDTFQIENVEGDNNDEYKQQPDNTVYTFPTQSTSAQQSVQSIPETIEETNNDTEEPGQISTQPGATDTNENTNNTTDVSNPTDNNNDNPTEKAEEEPYGRLKASSSVVDVLMTGPGEDEKDEENGGDEGGADPVANEEIEALKELFDDDMNLFLQFHKFINTFAEKESDSAKAKRRKLSAMFLSAMTKMVAKKRSNKMDRKMAVTVCIVILLHEFSKFDSNAKEYAAKAKSKELRGAWVSKFAKFNIENDGVGMELPQDEKELEFGEFFTSFWNFLPDWPEPPKDE